MRWKFFGNMECRSHPRSWSGCNWEPRDELQTLQNPGIHYSEECGISLSQTIDSSLMRPCRERVSWDSRLSSLALKSKAKRKKWEISLRPSLAKSSVAGVLYPGRLVF